MLSVTDLSSYLFCARKLFLEKVLGFAEFPKEAMVKGTVRHEFYERLNQKEESIITSIGEKMSLEDIISLYVVGYRTLLHESIRNNKGRLEKVDLKANELFRQVWPILVKEAQTRAQNIHEFSQLHLVFGKKLWEKLTPKITSEFRIASDTLQLKGIIDQIETYPKGRIPVELKTGSCPREGVWPNHRVQIGAYALLLEERYGQPVKEAFVTYVDAQERRHVPINPFLREEIKDILRQTRGVLQNRELPDYCGNMNKCNACSLKDTCYNPEKVGRRMEEVFNVALPGRA